MKGFTIYVVMTGDGDVKHFASLAGAKKFARECLDESDYLDEIEITRDRSRPLTKETFVEILNTNGGGWSQTSEVASVVRRRR